MGRKEITDHDRQDFQVKTHGIRRALGAGHGDFILDSLACLMLPL